MGQPKHLHIQHHRSNTIHTNNTSHSLLCGGWEVVDQHQVAARSMGRSRTRVWHETLPTDATNKSLLFTQRMPQAITDTHKHTTVKHIPTYTLPYWNATTKMAPTSHCGRTEHFAWFVIQSGWVPVTVQGEQHKAYSCQQAISKKCTLLELPATKKLSWVFMKNRRLSILHNIMLLWVIS